MYGLVILADKEPSTTIIGKNAVMTLAGVDYGLQLEVRQFPFGNDIIGKSEVVVDWRRHDAG